jgi:hypothetical protein
MYMKWLKYSEALSARKHTKFNEQLCLIEKSIELIGIIDESFWREKALCFLTHHMAFAITVPSRYSVKRSGFGDVVYQHTIDIDNKIPHNHSQFR